MKTNLTVEDLDLDKAEKQKATELDKLSDLTPQETNPLEPVLDEDLRNVPVTAVSREKETVIKKTAASDNGSSSALEAENNGENEADVVFDSVFQDGEIEESPYGKLQHRGIVNEMEKSYLDYAMSVIVARALPDVRDGLKPVHRRILYMMYKSGMHYNAPYKKSARIVGDVLGRFHPHGDSSVYGALARLAQDFMLRYPLVDGQGNFGSIDGDSPAAMRYTEARLAKISEEILIDIEKNTVNMVDNFDGSLKEPSVLPGRLPNLLLMGSEGIAVGMATKIPPHNLTEVCEAIKAMIKNGKTTLSDETPTFTIPEKTSDISTNSDLIDQLAGLDYHLLAGDFESVATTEEIMGYIKGPDFPTKAIIYDRQAILEAYATGKGRVVMRAKAEIVETPKNGYQILITEIPYQVNKAKLIMKIADLVKTKRIIGIRDINDNSDRQGLLITIDLKRDAKPKVVLNKLFKYSELQATFPVNMVALDSTGTPQLMNIKQILREYIIHRQNVVIRRSQYDLIKNRDRAHILEGLIIALNNLDEVIATIRASKTTDDAKDALMSKFKLTELQSLAILEMQLKRLAALERQKIEEEYQQIQINIAELLHILTNPQKILGVILDETQELIDNYGDDRLTKVVKGKVGEFSDEDLVSNEKTVITLTQTGYIKRLSPDSFRGQARGGKGVAGVKMKEEDVVKFLLTANTHDYILLFTNLGRVFKLRVFDIPEASKQAKGTAAVNLINLRGEEKVESILIIDPEKDTDKYITLATKNGLIKKTAVKMYDNIRQNGIIAISLNQNDTLVWGKLTSGDDEIMLITHAGKSIRFSETEVKASSRDTKGVKGINLNLASDYVVGVESITKDEASHDNDQQLLVVTEHGLGKRTAFSAYPLQKRSGSGVKVSAVTDKTGNVVAATKVNKQSEDVLISTGDGQTIKLSLNGKTIPVLSRPTQGVILMRPATGDKVVTATVTLKQEIEEEVVAGAAGAKTGSGGEKKK